MSNPKQEEVTVDNPAVCSAPVTKPCEQFHPEEPIMGCTSSADCLSLCECRVVPSTVMQRLAPPVETGERGEFGEPLYHPQLVDLTPEESSAVEVGDAEPVGDLLYRVIQKDVTQATIATYKIVDATP